MAIDIENPNRQARATGATRLRPPPPENPARLPWRPWRPASQDSGLQARATIRRNHDSRYFPRRHASRPRQSPDAHYSSLSKQRSRSIIPLYPSPSSHGAEPRQTRTPSKTDPRAPTPVFPAGNPASRHDQRHLPTQSVKPRGYRVPAAWPETEIAFKPPCATYSAA